MISQCRWIAIIPQENKQKSDIIWTLVIIYETCNINKEQRGYSKTHKEKLL